MYQVCHAAIANMVNNRLGLGWPAWLGCPVCLLGWSALMIGFDDHRHHLDGLSLDGRSKRL